MKVKIKTNQVRINRNLNSAKMHFRPNLVILAWTADELWGGQAQKEVKFDFQVKFDLEGQDRSSPKTIGTLTKVFCTFVSNLVILAWTSGELSCEQARDWYTHTRTHGHTDTQMQATTIPKGQNWPRVTIKTHQTYIFRSRYAIILKIAWLTIYNRDWKKHNKICTVGKIGHVTLVAVTGTIKLVSYLKSSRCNSFEDLEPVDLSSHKVAETAWQYARMVAQQ